MHLSPFLCLPPSSSSPPLLVLPLPSPLQFHPRHPRQQQQQQPHQQLSPSRARRTNKQHSPPRGASAGGGRWGDGGRPRLKSKKSSEVSLYDNSSPHQQELFKEQKVRRGDCFCNTNSFLKFEVTKIKSITYHFFFFPLYFFAGWLETENAF